MILPFAGPTLSLEINARFAVALRTAAEQHLPPTLYTGATGCYGRHVLRWDELDGEYTYDEMPQNYRTPMDLLIEQGYQFWQDSICPKCGTPWWYGRTTDNRVQFEVTQETCYSCEELERFTEQVSSGKNPKKRHGVTDQVSPVGVYYEGLGEREPLPTPFELLR